MGGDNPIEQLGALAFLRNGDADLAKQTIGLGVDDCKARLTVLPSRVLRVDPLARLRLRQAKLHEREASDRRIGARLGEGTGVVDAERT